MPSSSASHSFSSVQTVDPKPASAQDTTADSSDRDDEGGGGGNAPSWPATECVASYLRSQKSVHALCEKFGVNTKAFTPIPADDRRVCSPPPAGSICLYADALEAGMRVPLDPFFCEVLSHFGVAPSQLSPNCWRILAAFLALSRAAGVQLPSVPVFLHFFALRVLKVKGLYCFSPKDAAGVLFTGLPDKIKRWKERFFFLKSSAPWPCPVLWGEPTKKSTADPVLTNEGKSAVAKLLSVRGAAPIDVLIYLSEGDLAAARMTPRAPKPPTPSPSYRATGAKELGMDPSTYAMMQNMLAEKAAAEAAAAAAAKVAVKSEPGCSTPPAAENNTKEATGHGWASVPPGFSTRQKRKLQHAPDRHDGDTVGWEAARQLLQGVITPARERAFLVADPFTVIATSYIATLQGKSAVAKLLSVRGAAPIDVLIYLSEGDLAAARMTPRAPKPPTPSPSYRATGARGMDPSTYAMMQNMRAEKAAADVAAAAKVAVKSEPGCSAPPAAVNNTKEATGHGWASVSPGFSTRQKRKLQHAPDRHDGDTVGWEAARQLLQGVITPARERAFLVVDPFTVIATNYIATLQAANYATFSLGHALKLQEELEKAKAAAVEAALKGYERGMEDMKRVALRLRPDIDAAQLFVPPGGFQ